MSLIVIVVRKKKKRPTHKTHLPQDAAKKKVFTQRYFSRASLLFFFLMWCLYLGKAAAFSNTSCVLHPPSHTQIRRISATATLATLETVFAKEQIDPVNAKDSTNDTHTCIYYTAMSVEL